MSEQDRPSDEAEPNEQVDEQPVDDATADDAAVADAAADEPVVDRADMAADEPATDDATADEPVVDDAIAEDVAAEPVTDDAQAAPGGPFPDMPVTAAPTSRAARRARRRRVSGITALVVIALLVVLFGLLGYQSFNNRLESARQVDTATARIEEADVIVVQVDTVVRSEVTSELAQPAELATAQLPQAQAALEEAIRLLDEARAGNNLDDLRRNELLRNAAAARLEMVQQAPAILALNAGAAKALAPARQGWDKLVAADRKSDVAVAAYNKLTKSGVRESRDLNKQVAVDLAAARASFAQAEQVFPEGPFEEYIAYIDLRIALNALSRQSDSAWLKGKVKDANSITSSYNAQDAQAVQKARTLPQTPEKAIADAFTQAAQKPMDAYYRARDAATDADEALK